VEEKIQQEYLLLKNELIREIKCLHATLMVLTVGSVANSDDSELEALPAEKLVELKRKLKKKLDAALPVNPAADVRFKKEQKT